MSSDSWKSNYKSMDFNQLLAVRFPIWMDERERGERAQYILEKLRIEAPRVTAQSMANKRSPQSQFGGFWMTP